MRVSKKILTIFICALFAQTMSASSPKIKIWKGVKGMENQISWIKYYPASSDKGPCPAVIICPGGSYHHLGLAHEGYDVAKWFAANGINAFVLRYRVSGDGYKHPAMLEDIQRSIWLIRKNAQTFNTDPSKVGAIGFSAGGHLVVMAGAFGDTENELIKYGISSDISVKPDFVMPIYPVVSMQKDIGHEWSRKSLLGKNPTQEQLDKFSMELQITDQMCPVFLFSNKDDKTVKYENSERLAKAMKKAGIIYSYYLGDTGGHGFGMGNNKFVRTTKWNQVYLKPWLEDIGILPQTD